MVAALTLSNYLQHFLLLAGEQKGLSKGLVFYLNKFDLPSRGNCCSYTLGSTWWGKGDFWSTGIGVFPHTSRKPGLTQLLTRTHW